MASTARCNLLISTRFGKEVRSCSWSTKGFAFAHHGGTTGSPGYKGGAELCKLKV